jgi:hypothetical protein
MREQALTYYPLMSFEDIDWKIKEVGEAWRNLKDITISYEGGAYRLSMMASELKTGQCSMCKHYYICNSNSCDEGYAYERG